MAETPDDRTPAQRIMYGMTFITDPEPHEFIPCPGAALGFCRVCGREELLGKHVQPRKRGRP